MDNPSQNSVKKPEITASYAVETISKFLPEDWEKVSPEDVTITQIIGGYLNTLWIVKDKKSGNAVILRHYGGTMFYEQMEEYKKQAGDNLIKNSETEEVVIFYEQSRRNWGPKLFGVFPGGRIEEYVEGHTLTPEEAGDPDVIQELAIAYARYNCHDFPFPKDKIKRLSEMVTNPKPQMDQQLTPEQQAEISKLFAAAGLDPRTCFKVDIQEEMVWLFTAMQVLPLKYAFINYDTNFLNVLVRSHVEEDQERILIIDYEMAFYAPRGIDIGSHWLNRMVTWNGKETKVSGHEFPPEDQRRLFVKEYLKELERIKGDSFNEDGKETEEHLMMEADFGVLFFSLFFSAILSRHASNFAREPSFLTVIPLFQDAYVKHKQMCKEKYKQWP